MVIETLSASAIIYPTSFFTEEGKAISKKSVEIIFEKIGSLYNAIKNKFSTNPYSKQSLERLETKLDSKSDRLLI